MILYAALTMAVANSVFLLWVSLEAMQHAWIVSATMNRYGEGMPELLMITATLALQAIAFATLLRE